jgi:hypothetical protein
MATKSWKLMPELRLKAWIEKIWKIRIGGLNGGSQNHGFQYWNGLILDLGNPNLGNLQLTSGWSGKFSAADRDGFVLSVSVALVFQGKLTRNYVLILFKWKPCFWSLVQNQCQVQTPTKISKDQLILVVVHSLQPNQNKPVGQCQPRPTWAWKCPQSPEKTQSSFFGRTASIEFRL